MSGRAACRTDAVGPGLRALGRAPLPHSIAIPGEIFASDVSPRGYARAARVPLVPDCGRSGERPYRNSLPSQTKS